MDQHFAHLVPVMALELEDMSQMWTLVSKHYFSCKKLPVRFVVSSETSD